MIWIILIVVVVFLIGSALPLINQINYEKQQRKIARPDPDDEQEGHDEDGGQVR